MACDVLTEQLFASMSPPAFEACEARGGPIRTGWNNTAAAKVHPSDKAINFPMLAMPRCSESQRLPKAVLR